MRVRLDDIAGLGLSGVVLSLSWQCLPRWQFLIGVGLACVEIGAFAAKLLEGRRIRRRLLRSDQAGLWAEWLNSDEQLRGYAREKIKLALGRCSPEALDYAVEALRRHHEQVAGHN